MSDEPTPAGYPVTLTEPYVQEAEPSKAKLYCKHPGCRFETTSPAGLQRHKTIQHDRKKEAKKTKPTVDYGKKPSTPTKRIFKEIDYDGNGRVMLKTEDGWWIATKVNVV